MLIFACSTEWYLQTSLDFLFCSFNPDAKIPVPFPGPEQHPHQQKDGTDWNFGVHPNGAHVKFEHTKGPTTFGGHVGVQRGSKPSWGVTFRHRFWASVSYAKGHFLLSCVLIWILYDRHMISVARILVTNWCVNMMQAAGSLQFTIINLCTDTRGARH